MAIFAIRYTYSADTELVAQVRPKHREFLHSLLEKGDLLASGPFVGTNGALLIVKADDAAAAFALVEPDPFNQAGAISAREIFEWTQIYGPWA